MNITNKHGKLFYLDKKGFIFFSDVHEVSEQTFWVRGPQLRKQCIYAQALPTAPLCVSGRGRALTPQHTWDYEEADLDL